MCSTQTTMKHFLQWEFLDVKPTNFDNLCCTGCTCERAWKRLSRARSKAQRQAREERLVRVGSTDANVPWPAQHMIKLKGLLRILTRRG